MPESPRWLIQKGRSSEAAVVLHELGEVDTASAIDSIQHSLREEEAANRAVGWSAILCPEEISNSRI